MQLHASNTPSRNVIASNSKENIKEIIETDIYIWKVEAQFKDDSFWEGQEPIEENIFRKTSKDKNFDSTLIVCKVWV
ncbi:hypothetical protein N9K77_00575 [bacterium]|nr:hypothetical protein [bacterium]